MSSIVYDYFGGLYINLTNRCPCRCEFCIKNYTNSLGDADSLMLESEPSVEEVLTELNNTDINKYDEIVFCGYGEPTERLPELLEIAKYLKDKTNIKLRINTIGLANLRYGRDITPEFEGLIDAVNVSMNESDEEKYIKLCHPEFGTGSYDAMLDFIKNVKQHVPSVTVSVVGGSLSRESAEKCASMAKELGVGFRIR